MRILAYNAGHDGAAVLLEDGRLAFSLESEKDNGARYDRISLPLFLRSLQFERHPDVLALSSFPTTGHGIGAEMRDADPAYWAEGQAAKVECRTPFAGREIPVFSTSHLRSHVLCSYGLSPFPQGQPCYALVWEGAIGALYYVDENVCIRTVGEVLRFPGTRYTFPYALGSPDITPTEVAGRVMALAAYGRKGAATVSQRAIIDAICSVDAERFAHWALVPSTFAPGRDLCGIGVESQPIKDLAWQLSAAIFDRFHQFAERHVNRGYPLLVCGGCGLNCEWNSQWKRSGLFSDVFVPPCVNDSGVALGAAIDAQHHYTGKAKVQWSVYAGDNFIEDEASAPNLECVRLDVAEVSECLLQGEAIAWVQGRYEMGPRALGNRSLLAAPFAAGAREKLNRIKQREGYRPIAPICLEEDFAQHFEPGDASPHMLYFQRVKSDALEATTHVDGSARAQSVNERENAPMWALLRAFKELSGVGVLCNTSLNFRARGFVNRMSQLTRLVHEREIDGFVVGERFWRHKASVYAQRTSLANTACAQ